MVKTRAKAAMSKNVKYVDTAPEKRMGKIVEEFLIDHPNIRHYVDRDAYVTDPVDNTHCTFQLDHLLVEDAPNGCKMTVINVNGPHHDTPSYISKDRWRNALLVRHNYNVVNCHWFLLETDAIAKKYTPHIKQWLEKGLMKNNEITNIPW